MDEKFCQEWVIRLAKYISPRKFSSCTHCVLKLILISLYTALLGYAEVCVQCSLSVALERNSKRPIPIPHSTIESMEWRIELPEPAQHHWEKRSMVVRSDCEDERFLHTTV